MDKYYYLIASLPLLQFTEKPKINSNDFIAESKKWLQSDDFLVLSKLNKDSFCKDSKDPHALAKYKEFEYSIRKEITDYRQAIKTKTVYKLRKDLSGILEQEKNPLEVERELLLFRWNLLEELELGHCFDLDFLIIYYLKLQLLERLFIFDKEQGKEKFQALLMVEL